MLPHSKYIIAAVAVALLVANPVHAQPDPDLKPTYGSVTLKAGFLPDPFKKNLVAGGQIKTNLGGVNAYVAKAPDFSLNYAKGKFPLTISAKSVGDTTLLINLPDGTWIADDDSGGGLDPSIRIASPQSGRYDIYVGTFAKNPLSATLFITERDAAAAPPPVAVKGNLPDCYIVAAGVDNYINANKLNGCLNDARNTVAAFKAQTGIVFNRVEAQTLLNSSATRAGIHQKFQAFSGQGKAHDFMVLFLSGHGARANGAGPWYYLPFDFNPGNSPNTVLTDTQILDAGHVLVKQKKNVVIIIDACFCGQMHATAKRYFNNYKDGGDGGMILMLSSAAHQTSAALGNYSAFAKAFADAMAGGGDLNKDGKITLGEIQSYTFSRTAQLLAQSRIKEKQDCIVAWSPSISPETPLAYAGKVTPVAVRTPPTGTPMRWTGAESLAGFGKLSFAMYPDGRAIMVDAKETTEGIWQKSDNQITLSFFDGSVVYAGTRNGATLSGTATSPAPRTNAMKSWTWSVKLQSGN